MAQQPSDATRLEDSEIAADDRPTRNGNAQDIVHTIDRLKSELSERRCDDRPLPGSVERAYKITIDKYYAQLEQCGPRSSHNE